MPAAGGAPRPLPALPSPGSRGEVLGRLAVAPGVVGVLVRLGREGTLDEVRVYAGPPSGPLALRSRTRADEGRRLRVRITCVAAPASGCRGTVRLGRRGEFGRGPFRVAADTRGTVAVRLTDRGMRRVRERLHDVPFLSLSARVRDGRAHGTDGVVVARVRR